MRWQAAMIRSRHPELVLIMMMIGFDADKSTLTEPWHGTVARHGTVAAALGWEVCPAGRFEITLEGGSGRSIVDDF